MPLFDFFKQPTQQKSEPAPKPVRKGTHTQIMEGLSEIRQDTLAIAMHHIRNRYGAENPALFVLAEMMATGEHLSYDEWNSFWLPDDG